jgi:hypothetical protein
LKQLNEDAFFRESVQTDPKGAVARFGLSPAEQVALSSGDEDALRRLTGSDVSGFMLGGSVVMQSIHYRCVPHEPGTGTGTGTGTGGQNGAGPRRFERIS